MIYEEQVSCLGDCPNQSNKLAKMMGWRLYNNGGFTHLQPYDESSIGIDQFFQITEKFKTERTEHMKDNLFKNQVKTTKSLRKSILDEIVKMYEVGVQKKMKKRNQVKLESVCSVTNTTSSLTLQQHDTDEFTVQVNSGLEVFTFTSGDLANIIQAFRYLVGTGTANAVTTNVRGK